MDSALSDHVLGREIVAPAGDDPGDPSETALHRRLGQALAKAVKGMQLYPPENPMCVRFADELYAVVNECFRVSDLLRLTVGKTRIYAGGEPVLEQEGRDESIPGRLFWDGIREIAFHVGITREELVSFLVIFRRARMGDEDREDDLVTLLWECRLDHITYIAVNDILDMANADDPVPAEFGQEFMNYVDLDMHNIEDEEEVNRAANEVAESIRAKLRDEDDPELFGIKPEERAALQAELADEESPRMLKDIVVIIQEALYLETDGEAFVGLVQVLNGTMLGLLGEGRLPEATEILGLLRELRQARTDLTPAMSTVLEAGIHASWDETRRGALTRHLEAGKVPVQDGLPGYLRTLPLEAVGPVCSVLLGVENPKVRRRFLDAVVEKTAGDPRPFLPLLRDPRPEMVRLAIEILGAVKSEAAVKPLAGLIRHPEFQVRREALAALALLGRGKALDVLQDALLDPDPRIRMAAARALATTGRRAIPPLLALLESPGFEQKDLAEKRTVYEAIGFAGKTEVLPLLRQVLGRRALLKRGSLEEAKACACEALGWIGGAEAKALLAEQLQDRSVLVRTAAQSGLRRIASQDNLEFTLKEAA